jgi:hypothetical protein
VYIGVWSILPSVPAVLAPGWRTTYQCDCPASSSPFQGTELIYSVTICTVSLTLSHMSTSSSQNYIFILFKSFSTASVV